MLDPVAIETLEAVVDHGTIALAAEQLHKAPSAVSYHLRRLEESVGLRLLDRSGYRLTLTAEGSAFLEEARGVLRQLRELGSIAARFDQGWEPRLRIIYDGALPPGPILAALGEMERQRAPTRVDLSVSFLDRAQQAFDRGEADIVVAAVLQPRHDLIVRDLQRLSFVLCCGARHALAGLESVSLSRLRRETELVVPGLAADAGFYKRHFGGRRIFRMSDFHTKLAALSRGLGFGWLPVYMAAPHLDNGDLSVVRYEGGSSYDLVPQFASRVDQPLGRAGRLLLERFVQDDWSGPG